MNDRNFQRAHNQYLTSPEELVEIDCDRCGGSGMSMSANFGDPCDEVCPDCKGDGSIQQSKAEQQECIDNERADMDREEQSFREQSEGHDL